MLANGGAAPELVECVYQAVTCDEAWREVLSRLGEGLGAEAAILAHHDADAGGGALLHSVGVDTALAARYASEFAPKNPWMVDAQRYRPGQVFIGEDAAGGGTDLDASAAYDLSGLLDAYEAHPIGADTEHKVFW